MAEPWYLEVRVPSVLAQPGRLRSLVAERLSAASLDLVILAVITIAAGVPRLALLMDIPVGFHGDEGIAGIAARAILDEGYIGPFTRAAAGTPTGTFYWAAAFFWLFGDTPHVLRIAFALLGVATIPLAYLAFKVMFGRTVAYTAALLLAVSAWHLIYSRVAFVPVAWPLVEMAAMLFLFLAFRYESKPLFALTGVWIGFGIYTYGGYPTFAAAVGVFFFYMAFVHYSKQLSRLAGWTAIVLGAAFFAGLPMASWAHDNPELYKGRLEKYSITNTREWKDADNIFERGKIVFDHERDYIGWLIDEPIPDNVDAAGYFPLINRVFLSLLIVGGAMALWRWRSPQYAFLIICIVVIAMGPAVTVEAPYRRTLGLVPMLCALAALPLAAIWQNARRMGGSGMLAGGVVAAGLFAGTAGIDVHRYFDTFENNQSARWVYVPELTEASEYLESLADPKPYVYFYSYRWMFNYETRVLLAPDFEGEDRSVEFGFVDPPSLEADRSRNVVFLFLPPYEPLADQVMQRYPGGTLTEDYQPDGSVNYRAYLLPAEPSIAP
jgi:4-amino-4-deoxy-L-arabinose transferase-like glycosyltransferase